MDVRSTVFGKIYQNTDTKKINKLGWYAKTSLEEGIQKTLNYCLEKNIFFHILKS